MTTIDISGLSTPHAFLIRKLTDGKVGVKFKQWISHNDEAWQGSSDLPHDWMVFMKEFPVGYPNFLLPNPLATQATFNSICNSFTMSDNGII